MAVMSDNTKGALLMICSMAAFTFNDALVKLLGTDVPLFQMLFLRGVMASVLIWGLARWIGQNPLVFVRGRIGALVALRTVAEIGAAYFFITALYHMPIANVTAVLQILPLTVTLGGALFFGESGLAQRALAIALGFCGMLLIVRPGPDGFDQYALYALIAVVFVTLRDLATRKMSADVPSLTVTLVASLGVTLASGVASFGTEWVTLTPGQWASVGRRGGVYPRGLFVFCVGDAGRGGQLHRALPLQRPALGTVAGVCGLWRLAGPDHPDRRRHCRSRRGLHADPWKQALSGKDRAHLIQRQSAKAGFEISSSCSTVSGSTGTGLTFF